MRDLTDREIERQRDAVQPFFDTRFATQSGGAKKKAQTPIFAALPTTENKNQAL